MDVDDIDAAAKIAGEWRPPPLRPLDRFRISAGLVLAALPGALARKPKLEFDIRGRRHTRARDEAAVRCHYDAGNDFFGLFLDDAMVYSCGVYSRGAKTLEEAQRTKLDLIATKLGLKPGGVRLRRRPERCLPGQGPSSGGADGDEPPFVRY